MTAISRLLFLWYLKHENPDRNTDSRALSHCKATVVLLTGFLKEPLTKKTSLYNYTEDNSTGHMKEQGAHFKA